MCRRRWRLIVLGGRRIAWLGDLGKSWRRFRGGFVGGSIDRSMFVGPILGIPLSRLVAVVGSEVWEA